MPSGFRADKPSPGSKAVYLVDNGYDPAAYSSLTKDGAIEWVEGHCQGEEVVIWHRLMDTTAKKLYQVAAVWKGSRWL